MKIKTKIKPHFEIIKDVGTGYTWRNERGIVNVIFNLDNSITWASYIEEGEQKNKGKFYSNDKIPDELIEAINKLEAKDEDFNSETETGKRLGLVLDVFADYQRLQAENKKLTKILKQVVRDYTAMKGLFEKLDMKLCQVDTKETIEYLNRVIKEQEK